MCAETLKQRHIRDRQELIVEASGMLLLEHGYHDLTMAHIAEAIGCSRPTVYQHFPCKEDVLLEAANKYSAQLLGVYEKAVAIPGKPRERLSAAGVAVEAFLQLYPGKMKITASVHAAPILSRADKKRRTAAMRLNQRFLDATKQIVLDAIITGDLTLGPGDTPESVTYGFWLIQNGVVPDGPGQVHGLVDGLDFRSAVRQNIHRLADGYGWHPLSGEWDYTASEQRIKDVLFPHGPEHSFQQMAAVALTNEPQ